MYHAIPQHSHKFVLSMNEYLMILWLTQVFLVTPLSPTSSSKCHLMIWLLFLYVNSFCLWGWSCYEVQWEIWLLIGFIDPQNILLWWSTVLYCPLMQEAQGLYLSTIGRFRNPVLDNTRVTREWRSSNPPTSWEWKPGSANAFSCRFLMFETAVLVSSQLECCQERGFKNAP
jgi:hypothetical protein